MSAPRNPNRRMAQAVVEELGRCGVTEACVSPGSRSTALALALDAAPGMRVFVVGDERCGGFFALGLARERQRPVVLLCTSGTAAANYLPAVVEASLSDVPLVVVTADRPPELRDCGAAQTITQVGLFAGHVRWSVDVPAPSADVDLERYYRTLACRAAAAAVEPPAGPVHVNLPMREPLFDPAEEEAIALEPVAREPFVTVHSSSAVAAPATLDALVAKLGRSSRGLIVCGPGTDRCAAAPIATLARLLGWPILADPISGLRFGAHDRSHVADAYDVLLRDREFSESHRPETIVQIGALPASKPLARFLEASPRLRHVVVAPARRWPDPFHRASDVVRADAAELCAALAARLPARSGASTWLGDWVGTSTMLRAAIERRALGSRGRDSRRQAVSDPRRASSAADAPDPRQQHAGTRRRYLPRLRGASDPLCRQPWRERHRRSVVDGARLGGGPSRADGAGRRRPRASSTISAGCRSPRAIASRCSSWSSTTTAAGSSRSCPRPISRDPSRRFSALLTASVSNRR